MSTQIQTSSARQLQAVLPGWCALQWHQALLSGFFVLLFVYFSLLPVSSVATWQEIVAGQLALGSTAGNFTQLVPLSEGVRHFEIGWAGSALIALIHGTSGSELLSLSFAALQTCSLICFSLVFFRLSGRWWSGLFSGLTVIACLARFDGIHGQTIGYLLFSCLVLATLSARPVNGEIAEWSKSGIWGWLSVVVIFVTWANVDPSFVLGLAWLGLLAVSRLVQAVSRSGLRFFRDREFQSRVWLLEIAFAATAINPDGIDLWKSFFWCPDNPFLQALFKWSPVTLTSWTGIVMAAGWASWFWASRYSSKLSLFWVLVAVLATIGLACSESFVVWFVPLMMISILGVAGPSLWGSGAQASPRRLSPDTRPSMKFAYTLIVGLLIWIGFCLSPAHILIGGKPRADRLLFGKRLPVDALKYLNQSQTNGLILVPSYWSDWIQAHLRVPVFVNDDPSLVPASVISDYRQVYDGEANWLQILEKYDLERLMIDKRAQQRLLKNIRREAIGWSVTYEDEQTVVLDRG